MPRTHCPIPHKDGDIEQHVDGGLETVVRSLEPEPIIPGEDVAGDEAGEDVVRADEAYCAGYEELSRVVSQSRVVRRRGNAYRERDGEDEKGFSIHIVAFFCPV